VEPCGGEVGVWRRQDAGEGQRGVAAQTRDRGGERGGLVRETGMWANPRSGAQRPVKKEFNSKFQIISNKFKTIQTWFIPKWTFSSLKYLK
jgi:hypothetical protein